MIIFTAMILLTIHSPFSKIVLDVGAFKITFPQMIWAVWSVLYLICDFITGFLTLSIGCVGLYATNELIAMDASKEGLPYGLELPRVILIMHIIAWLMQFVGHGIFEQRAPALLTNLAFAQIAPFFCMFEYLHLTFGYKQDLKD